MPLGHSWALAGRLYVNNHFHKKCINYFNLTNWLNSPWRICISSVNIMSASPFPLMTTQYGWKPLETDWDKSSSTSQEIRESKSFTKFRLARKVFEYVEVLMSVEHLLTCIWLGQTYAPAHDILISIAYAWSQSSFKHIWANILLGSIT